MKMETLNRSNLTYFAKDLLSKRQTHSCTASLKTEAIEYLNGLIDFLFPHFSNKVYLTEEDILSKVQLLKRDLIQLIKLLNGQTPKNTEYIAESFIQKIPAKLQDPHSLS